MPVTGLMGGAVAGDSSAFFFFFYCVCLAFPECQIHPHLGGNVLLVEAINLAAVQMHTYPWTERSRVRRA